MSQSAAGSTKDTPYLALTGAAMGSLLWISVRSWPRYNAPQCTLHHFLQQEIYIHLGILKNNQDDVKYGDELIYSKWYQSYSEKFKDIWIWSHSRAGKINSYLFRSPSHNSTNYYQSQSLNSHQKKNANYYHIDIKTFLIEWQANDISVIACMVDFHIKR